jgi:hypothetical protein
VSVDPSSLIFVVIIGIWALYLVQHWVRRREQVATSRSVDRFSEAMRVLERRAPIPIELPARSSRPYVVAPALASATSTGGAALTSRPEVAMKQAPNVRSDRPDRPERPEMSPAMSRPARPAARTVVLHRTHRMRALIFLTLFVATPSVWAAHEFGTLLLWPTLTVTVLLVLDLLLVRSAVRRERAARRRVARTSAPVRRSARPAAQAKPFPAAAATGSVRPAAPSRTARAAGRPADSVVAAAGTSTTTAAPMHSQEAITEVILREGEWAPVAVPPPTYTMKAKADRPVSGVGPLVAESDSAPTREPLQPAVEIDDFDLDSVLDRRRAAGE